MPHRARTSDSESRRTRSVPWVDIQYSLLVPRQNVFLGSDRRHERLDKCAFPDSREDVDIEEVHPSDDHEHGAELRAQQLDRARHINWAAVEREHQAHVSEIHEIEADDEKLIHRIRERGIVLERIY